MSERKEAKLVKWPFLAGDVLLVATAVFIVWQRNPPLSLEELALCAGGVLAGALFGVMPFVLEHRAAVRLSEADTLAGTLKQLQQIEAIGKSVNAATAQWHGIQDLADQTLKAAKQVAELMTAEAAAFREFIEKAGDAEKATLRLEVEKLSRAQADWLQVLVLTLDHVFALHKAALRSAKPEVIEQISRFQSACRDIARRVGLVPIEAAEGEPFDPAKHRLADDQKTPPKQAVVAETLATGYNFQGQSLRPVLVAVKAPESKQTRQFAAEERSSAAPQSAEPTLF